MTMLSIPSSRRFISPTLLLFIIIALLQIYLRAAAITKFGLLAHVIVQNSAEVAHNVTFEATYASQPSLQQRFLLYHYSSVESRHSNKSAGRPFSQCSRTPNPYTSHIRMVGNEILGISMVPSSEESAENEFSDKEYFNPALIPLPSYTSASSPSGPYQYLLISRLVTNGIHQESHVCFANTCSPGQALSKDRVCTQDDLDLLGPSGGMRCVTRPERVNILPTPAKKCGGAWRVFPDIPGFHDPRVFWSGRGEPLIEVNSGSMYACVGLWMQDLRRVYPPLEDILKRKRRDMGTEREAEGSDERATGAGGFPLTTGYPKLTELTRNPKLSRSDVEKNWVLFFPTEDEMWVQYDMLGNTAAIEHQGLRNTSWSSSDVESPRRSLPLLNGGRTISKLLSHGLSTPDLASPFGPSCFNPNSPQHSHDILNNTGHWHQGSNSLRLILCTRNQFHSRTCIQEPSEPTPIRMSWYAYEEYLRAEGRVLHFSIVHRKFSNELDLPMRYERYVLIWEAKPPFYIVGISRYPIALGNERVRPWSLEEDIGWHASAEFKKRPRQDVDRTAAKGDETDAGDEYENDMAYFTYTPSITWSWRPKDEDENMHLERGHEDLGTGYLGDEVIVGLGMDDVRQGIVKITVDDLLTCMRLCRDVDG